jgi:hypothetical protein
MEWDDGARLQLLLASNEADQMENVISMLHANGIQTAREITSLAWRSAGFESLLMVSTEDYPKASALCREYELVC